MCVARYTVHSCPRLKIIRPGDCNENRKSMQFSAQHVHFLLSQRSIKLVECIQSKLFNTPPISCTASVKRPTDSRHTGNNQNGLFTQSKQLQKLCEASRSHYIVARTKTTTDCTSWTFEIFHWQHRIKRWKGIETARKKETEIDFNCWNTLIIINLFQMNFRIFSRLCVNWNKSPTVEFNDREKSTAHGK